MKPFVFIFISQVIFYLFSYAFTWLIAKIFTPSIAGTYFLAFAIVTGGSILVRWGWGQSVLRYCSQYLPVNQAKARAFLISSMRKVILRGGVAIVCLFLVAKPVALFYQKNVLTPALIGLSFFLLFRPLNEIIIQYLRIQGRVILFALLQYVLTPFSKILILLLVFLLIRDSLPALSFGISASELVILALSLYFTRLFSSLVKHENSQLWNKFNDSEIKSYSKHIGINLFLVFLLNKSDIIYAGQWLTSEQIALYQIGKQISFVSVLILSGFEPIVAPAIAMAIGENRKEFLITGYQASIYYMGLLTVPVILAIFFNGRLILSYFGDFYVGGLTPMYILVCGQLVNIMTGQAGYVLSMGGHAKLTLLNSVISFALTFVLAMLLTPVYQLIGLAIAVSSGIATINILKLFQCNSLEGLKWISARHFFQLIAWAALALFLFIFQKLFKMQLVGIIFVFLVYYLSVFYIEIVRKTELYRTLTVFLSMNKKNMI